MYIAKIYTVQPKSKKKMKLGDNKFSSFSFCWFAFSIKRHENAHNYPQAVSDSSMVILKEKSSLDGKGLCSHKYLTLRVNVNFGADCQAFDAQKTPHIASKLFHTQETRAPHLEKRLLFQIYELCLLYCSTKISGEM
jgi:hypothetical protein